MKELLTQIGMDPERIRMFNMSSAMASQFVEATKEMNAQISELGSNPLLGFTKESKAVEQGE